MPILVDSSVWIATFCLREGLELLHDDRDFDLFARHLGLAVTSPA